MVDPANVASKLGVAWSHLRDHEVRFGAPQDHGHASGAMAPGDLRRATKTPGVRDLFAIAGG
jgi:hypothetical protein